MSRLCSGCGPLYGIPSLLTLSLLAALPGLPAAAVAAESALLDATLLQAAQAARATEAVAEAAARAAFLAPTAAHGQVPEASRTPQGSRGALGTGQSLPAPGVASLQAQPPPPPLADAQQLRAENERLRRERAQLAEDVLRLQQRSSLQEAQWQRDRQLLVREDSELRREDARLRIEDSDLRQTLARTADGTGRRRTVSLLFGSGLASQGVGRHAKILAVFGLLAAVGCTLAVCCSGNLLPRLLPGTEQEDEDEDDEDEAKLRDLVDQGRHVSCLSCLRCFCRPYMLGHICGIAVVSFVFGLVLWDLGLLQPMLSTILVYGYIMGVVIFCIALIAYEIWVLIAKSVSLVLDGINHPLAKARKNLRFKKNKCLNALDDGEFNPAGVIPERRGDRGRRGW